MKEQEWKPIVLADASKQGICGQYAGLLERCESLSDFLHLYRRGVDWALKHDVPRREMLSQYKSERLDLHGIYIDYEFDGEELWDRQVYILRNCHGRIKTGLNIDQKIIPMFYLSDGSDITFESANAEYLTRPILVPVYLFGDSVATSADKRIQCTIHK